MTVKQFDDYLKEQGMTKSQIQDLDYQIARHITYSEAEAYPGTLHEKAAAFYDRYRKIVAETDREHYLDNASRWASSAMISPLWTRLPQQNTLP